MSENQNSLRCSICLTNWPVHDDFRGQCVECGGDVKGIGQTTPLDMDEAISRKRHADFERFCEQRDEQRARDAAALFAPQPQTHRLS